MSKSVTRTIWIGTDDDGTCFFAGTELRFHGRWCGGTWMSGSALSLLRAIGLDQPSNLLPPPGEQRQYTITITPVEG